jgi:hypothetical protein
MRSKISFKHLKIIALILTAFFLTMTTTAMAEDNLQVEGLAICKDVVNREAVNAGNTFEASVDRLFCFTKIVGVAAPTEITHVWYFGETERARVSLSIKADNWRTYSSKRIQAHEVGFWRVEVLDSAGNVLESVRFEIVN